jgi:predicted Zn-dependent protease
MGDVSGLAAIAGQLGHLSFQRSDEESADREGMRMLRAAGIDPRAMIEVYRKLGRSGPELRGALRYLSTHPDMAGRLENLARVAAEAQAPYVRPIGIPGWPQIRQSCR